MPSTKKTVRPTAKSRTAPSKKPPISRRGQLVRVPKMVYERLHQRTDNFLNRRPHRSFRRTRRRDYVRPLRLPGYWSLTNQVRRVLWQNRGLFFFLGLTYTILSSLLVGLGSQAAYQQLTVALQTTGSQFFQGSLGALGQAALLTGAALNTGLNTNITDVQKVYSAILVLMAWLTTVWLLRALMAGQRPRLRDGLYNAGAPIIPTFLVGLVIVAQLLPVSLAAVGITAALPTGIFDDGALTMLVSIVAILLTLLSLYWITSTLLALVIVTLPGMYPMRAIRTAGDLVIGRRVRIIFRVLWLLFTLVLLVAVTMIPTILIDAWLKGELPALHNVPIVPVVLLLVGSISVIWSASYTYVFYRKIVDDDAAPA